MEFGIFTATLLQSGWGFSGVVALTLLAVLRRCLSLRAIREKELRHAVLQRTEDLERERSREKSRNGILEMLLTHQPLGAVLDRITQLLREEAPGSTCAIALRRGDRYDIVAAPGASRALISALQANYAIPFEVWSGSAEFRLNGSDSQSPEPSAAAWKIFLGHLREPAPAVIRTEAIGTPDRSLGACLVFEPQEECSRMSAERAADLRPTLQYACRLAQLAIEHNRFCDDLNFQAHHDSLTGLPNRVLFENRLAESLAEARNVSRRVAVFYVDLDRFKQINDTMSHRIGDLVLTETAIRMKCALRPGDTVARIGGDEFNVLAKNIGDGAEAEALADRLLEVIRQPMSIEGRTVLTSASIGISLFPDDGVEAEDLQREADAAMYCAKGLGRNRAQAFGAKNDALDSMRLDRELKKALRERLFAVHYQPKVDAKGNFAGMEALLRLSLPVHGSIPPARFIPVAEESGLIVPLGAWVLDEVCRQIAVWRAEGLGQVPVAVNVSPLQICRPEFAAEVEDCIRRHGVPPSSIELELTESLLIGTGEETQKQMRYLRGLGIRFSIDDFGTGYSSLSYLHRLRVDAIKLDRSFVQSIDTDDAARRLVQAMIGVAEGLGLGVIAEGVETEEQRAVLVAAGCPTMQGYLFSRPRAAADLDDYLRGAASNTDDLRWLDPGESVSADTAPVLISV